MEDKAMKYLTHGHGRIAAVLVVKMEYPKARWAKVSLLVADASQDRPRWALRDEVFYNERLDQPEHQPAGQIALYLSDLLCPHLPVPSVFCRPPADTATIRFVLWSPVSYLASLPSPLLLSLLLPILLGSTADTV